MQGGGKGQIQETVEVLTTSFKEDTRDGGRRYIKA